MRNIEIKARIENPEEFLTKVKRISDSEVTVIPQEDIFFKLPDNRPGRLKLRKYQVNYIFKIFLTIYICIKVHSDDRKSLSHNLLIYTV